MHITGDLMRAAGLYYPWDIHITRSEDDRASTLKYDLERIPQAHGNSKVAVEAKSVLSRMP